MAIRDRNNSKLKKNDDTGFGTTTDVGGRFINKDGTFNMEKVGAPIWDRFSIFHYMLNLPRWKFFATIICFYLAVNLCFTIVYEIIGTEQFTGMLAQTTWEKFKEIYFFSTETFTTVGYGRVNPIGDAANFVASIEALCGFLSLAIATGLIYGRFSKPQAFLVFSDLALVSPYQDKTGLMFRFVSFKDRHVLTDVDVKVTTGLQVQENGKTVYKFYSLNLERTHVDSLSMNFTVVHPIDDASPFQGLTEEDMKTADVELYVLVRGFDDVYSNIVQQRTSYTYHEIKFNAKFIPMYKESGDGNTTILELDKLNQYKEVPLPVIVPEKSAVS